MNIETIYDDETAIMLKKANDHLDDYSNRLLSKIENKIISGEIDEHDAKMLFMYDEVRVKIIRNITDIYLMSFPIKIIVKGV